MFLSGILARGRMRVKTNDSAVVIRIVLWLAVVIWLGGIFYLSHQAAPLGVTASPREAIAVHLGLYAALALLLQVALGVQRPGRWAVAVVALTALYGASDELHQAFVTGRTASWADIGLDAAGAALGVALALIGAWIVRTRSIFR